MVKHSVGNLSVYLGIAGMVSIFLGYSLYKEDFKTFHKDVDYNKKYFIYFFIILIFTGIFCAKVANINRNRIDIERGYSKDLIENGGVEPFDPKKEPTSIEGSIRLWYYNHFQKR